MGKLRNRVLLAARTATVVIAFVSAAAGAYILGAFVNLFADRLFPPLEGGTAGPDPSGRGSADAVAVWSGYYTSLYICVLLGVVAAWLTWLWWDKKNWSLDLWIGTPVFVVFAAITAANYIAFDILFTRDAQAVLNVLLVASGAATVLILQRSMRRVKSALLRVGGTAVLVFSTYAFIAIPLWYTVSFVSWKLGAGQLNSMDEAAKGLAAAASLLIFFGLAWKDGRLCLSSLSPKPPSGS